MRVHVWNSFSCNNSSEYRLVAEFATEAQASTMADELRAFFHEHAAQHDAVGEWPGAATKVAKQFGAKYTHEWKEPLVWGDDSLSEDEPDVLPLGSSLVVFHTYNSGFGADLPAVLERAGATFVERGEAQGAPVFLVNMTVPPGKKGENVRSALTAFFLDARTAKYGAVGQRWMALKFRPAAKPMVMHSRL